MLLEYACAEQAEKKNSEHLFQPIIVAENLKRPARTLNIQQTINHRTLKLQYH